ncbi:MAG: lipoyl synthase [Acidimicrobiales bacterium]
MTVAACTPSAARRALRVRWLGRVRYRDGLALQRGLWANGDDDWLLLMEHREVYTMGVRARPENLLVDPSTVGAELERVDRGGDVTYHGPGQLVGYPVMDVPPGAGASPCHVWRIEQTLIDALGALGVPSAGRLEGYPGVWLDPSGDNPRKIAAIGVRVSKGRSMHGFALNVDPDMAMFGHIVPCGIADKPVTSLAVEGLHPAMRAVVDAVVEAASKVWGVASVDRQDVAWKVQPSDMAPFTVTGGATATPVRMIDRRLAQAGVDPAGGLAVDARKPQWLRAPAHLGEDYRALRKVVRSLNLVTVCEEAGCPNIYECWADGTATFMINGERCTRACGFCLVDTAKPLPLDPDEPERVAEAVSRLGLSHAVVTCVARDDLPDGGASGFVATVEAVRRRSPGVALELLISDLKGDPASLEAVFSVRPEVLNHNVETVPRLQRAVRPSASYARSLAVLARAKAAGLTTKTGLVLGMGETFEEVASTLADLAGVGVDIVTAGQYLRPTAAHLGVARWWTPEEFASIAELGESLGIGHVEASPLTRSSYHARQAAARAGGGVGVPGQLVSL